MKRTTIITAAILACTPALACQSDYDCIIQPPPAPVAPIEQHYPNYSNSDDSGGRESYHYQPRTCVTNYGGGGVAITNCY